MLDCRFYTADTEVTLEIIRGNDTINLSIRKETYDDIGLEFESYLMDEQRRCKNKCVFCFIDQLPKGMRKPCISRTTTAGFFLSGIISPRPTSLSMR